MSSAAAPYGRFAGIYDRMDADDHSRKMVAYTQKIMQRFRIRPVDGLDLCCGTGTAIAEFADFGVPMAGLDRSKDMLAEARKKLKGRKVDLYCQALPRFEIRDSGRGITGVRRFDLVTCYYDSLNYLLTARDLKAAFRSVYRHVTPGGWFVFDMNTPHAMRTIWSSQIWGQVRDDIAWLFRNEYFESDDSANLYATFFVKSGKSWTRFDEKHTERGYPDDQIRAMLTGVGFVVKGFYCCFTFRKSGPRTNRIAVVVQRPA
ncbi:MAG: class I SAM-dependent methyltransferase [candidate division Zixibacteria bacterium]|nr:class I SAM-dependent methyltransferase [candidate division Zixibacteria bacterium]